MVVDIDPTIAELAVPGLEIRLEKPPESCDSTVTSARVSGHRMIWELAALSDRAAAAAWAGAAVLVAASALPETGEDEYFDFELLGAEVVDTEGKTLGEIREVIATGANDVLVAQGPSGEILIPLTHHAIASVERARHRVVVNARALVYEDEAEKS